jgi:polyisoprenyl-phosphate glycosyltransferase
MSNEALCPVCSLNVESGSHVGLLVPMFRSWNHVELLFDFVNKLDQEIRGGVNLTIVIDGCDLSEAKVREAIDKIDTSVRLVVLSRNFGVGPALRAGMSEQQECFTIAFGSDLQEPGALFVNFAEELLEGSIDFVLGQRSSRDDPYLSVIFAKIYWTINRLFIFKDSPRGGFDVYGCNRTARKALVNLEEQNTNITSQILWLGFRRKFVSFTRTSRTEGKSTWSFRKKLGLFFDSIYSFSHHFFTRVTLFISLSTITFLCISEQMNFSNNFKIIVLGGLASSYLLVLSGFVIRIYEQSQNRPTFIIRESALLKNRK